MKKITLMLTLLISTLGFGQNLLLDGDLENIDPGTGGQAIGVFAATTDNTTAPWTSNYGYAAGRSSINNNNLVAHAGNGFISMPNDYTYFRQPFTAVIGTSYTLTFWFQFIGGQGIPYTKDGISVNIKKDDGADGAGYTPGLSTYVDPSLYGLSTWNQITYTFTAQDTNLLIYISKPSRTTGANGGTALNNGARMDDFSIATTPLAVKDFAQFKFSSYPNPTSGQLNLSAAKNISKVELFNLLGQKVQSNTINAAQKQLDISNLQSGVYLMEVTIDNAKQAYKIVKQ